MSYELISIEGGTFRMGSDQKSCGFDRDQEGPSVELEVADFAMGAQTVTNRDFQAFFLDTAYVTDAERYGSSNVFFLLIDEDKRDDYPLTAGTDWWHEVAGASWRQPEGPGSTLEGRMDHPVVHVSHNDALAYCQWAGLRLPSESEWEYAAQAGHRDGRIYPWGNELEADGKHWANVWQGDFPNENTAADGYVGTAPAKAYAPNDYGLYQMIGNVWEWCSNPGRIPLTQFQDKTAEDWAKAYSGYDRATDFALRGGAFLCHHSYCQRYRIAGRNANNALSSTSNTGFRCAQSRA